MSTLHRPCFHVYIYGYFKCTFECVLPVTRTKRALLPRCLYVFVGCRGCSAERPLRTQTADPLVSHGLRDHGCQCLRYSMPLIDMQPLIDVPLIDMQPLQQRSRVCASFVNNSPALCSQRGSFAFALLQLPQSSIFRQEEWQRWIVHDPLAPPVVEAACKAV